VKYGSGGLFDRRLLIGLVTSSLLAVGSNVSANGYSSPADRNAVQRLVIREAQNFHVPVALALAVAHAESNFDPRAKSHAGARGVMQIMPATALGEYGIHPNKLWDAQTNIRLGLHYLHRLIGRYRGRTDLALSFYNGGSGVGRPGRARVLPATRGYVRKVQNLRFRYRQKLLDGQLWPDLGTISHEYKSSNHPREIQR